MMPGAWQALLVVGALCFLGALVLVLTLRGAARKHGGEVPVKLTEHSDDETVSAQDVDDVAKIVKNSFLRPIRLAIVLLAAGAMLEIAGFILKGMQDIP